MWVRQGLRGVLGSRKNRQTCELCVLSFHLVFSAGEYTLTHAVVNKLISMGIKAVSACTERIVTERIDESGNTVKESRFLFVKFREYC